mmetsp:Transcript_46308/g.68312  ORF Transcript_46308/g.68312 Transcript_46308/m.68312 type:complete len:88 (-) Transcript_46308:55-318(-)
MAPSTPPPSRHPSLAALTMADFSGFSGYEKSIMEPLDRMREKAFLLRLLVLEGIEKEVMRWSAHIVAVALIGILGRNATCFLLWGTW